MTLKIEDIHIGDKLDWGGWTRTVMGTRKVEIPSGEFLSWVFFNDYAAPLNECSLPKPLGQVAKEAAPFGVFTQNVSAGRWDVIAQAVIDHPHEGKGCKGEAS